MDLFYKQTKLLSDSSRFRKIIILGAGSIGSSLAFALAKTGFYNIHVIDYDIVESGNVPAQMFGLQDIDSLKTEAIKKRIAEEIGTQITITNAKLEPENIKKILPLDEKAIYIIAFDNIESRKLLLEYFKNKNIFFIDTRTGGTTIEILSGNFLTDTKTYADSLTGTFTQEECTAKGMYAINHFTISYVLQIIYQHTELKLTTIQNLLTDFKSKTILQR